MTDHITTVVRYVKLCESGRSGETDVWAWLQHNQLPKHSAERSRCCPVITFTLISTVACVPLNPVETRETDAASFNLVTLVLFEYLSNITAL